MGICLFLKRSLIVSRHFLEVPMCTLHPPFCLRGFLENRSCIIYCRKFQYAFCTGSISSEIRKSSYIACNQHKRCKTRHQPRDLILARYRKTFPPFSLVIYLMNKLLFFKGHFVVLEHFTPDSILLL